MVDCVSACGFDILGGARCVHERLNDYIVTVCVCMCTCTPTTTGFTFHFGGGKPSDVDSVDVLPSTLREPRHNYYSICASFGRIHSLLTQPENPALIVNPITNNNNGGLNYARCSPVLPKSDSCPAEKDYLTLPNMSLLQNNSATNQSKSNTRTDSWVESFVDLSEFCYPTITHTRMADSADELNTPTISSTVQHRGFGNLSDVNENLRILSENNKWYAQSPMFMREELSDPITDWLTTTSNKDSTTMINNVTTNSLLEALSSSTNNVTTTNNDNNNNNNVQNNNVQNNNVNDILLNHHQMLLLDDINRYDTNIVDMNYKIKNDPLLSSSALPPHHLQPPDSTFTTRRVGSNSAHTPRTIASLFASSYKPKLNVSATAVRPSSVVAADTTAITTTVSSPNNVQSPSISQSHLNLDESHTEFKIPSPGLVKRRNVKLDLKFGDGPFNPPCSMNTPEVLKPLVDKDLEFDLVSYVFEDNKPAAKILPSDDIVVTTGENITNEVVPLQTPKTDRYQGALLDSKLLLLDIAIKSEPPDIEDVVIIEPGCGGIKKNSNDHNNSNNVALNNIIVDDGDDDDDNKDAIIGSDYNRDIIEEVIIGGGAAAAGVEDDDKITPDFIDEIVISSNSNFNTTNNRNRLRTDSTNSSDNSSSNQDDVNSKRAAIITNRRNSSAVRLLSAYSPRRVRGSNNKVVVGGGKAVAAMKRKYEDTDDDDLDEEEEVEELGEREIEEIEEIFRPRTIGGGKTLSIFNNNNNNKNSSSSSSNSSNSTDDSKGKNDDKRRLSITDIALIESEKYRELRDRNNEASRRSRANRKTREVELQMQADVLEAENRSLKLRAERMEQLVKRLREILMKMVLKNNRIP